MNTFTPIMHSLLLWDSTEVMALIDSKLFQSGYIPCTNLIWPQQINPLSSGDSYEDLQSAGTSLGITVKHRAKLHCYDEKASCNLIVTDKLLKHNDKYTIEDKFCKMPEFWLVIIWSLLILPLFLLH